MSPTTRKRNHHDYVPRVVEAVKMLTKGNGHGASRQTIVKYVEERLNKGGTNGVSKLSSQSMVKSAIMRALNSGLLVHSSGVGLNGSFVIPEKSTNGSTGTCHEKQKRIITKEAKLRNISSLASGFTSAERPDLESTIKTVTSKRRRNSKIVVPFTDVGSIHQGQLESGQKSNALKAILKTPTKDKFAAKRRLKGSVRKVKFCSPPSVFFISPCIKRRCKRKK